MAQTAAQKAAAAKKAAAAAKAADQAMIKKLEAAIAKTKTNVSKLQKSAIELGAINPDVIEKADGETNTEFLERKQATEALARKNEMADNPLLNKAVKPTDAPAGKYYSWIGGTDTGSWKLYDIPGYGAGADGSGGGGGGGGGGGKKFTATDGTPFEDEDTYLAYQEMLDEKESALDIKKRQGQSAYDLLYLEFAKFGLGSLVEDVKQYVVQGLSKSELTLRLRTESKAYKKRFAANEQRIAKGLTALDESTYIGLEDQYQEIMRNYGLPSSYYAKDALGTQEGFEKFIANDVSSTELEDRIMTAQNRVINSNPEVLQAIKDFYGDSITNGDILAYTLNPTKGLEDIKRKVTAAEIGGAAVQSGLNLGKTAEERAAYAARAEQLRAAGVDKAAAQEGFQTVAQIAPRGGQLAEIYKQNPYTQQTAEAEVFGLGGSAEAIKQRKRLTSLETAAFGGSAGAGAIARDRAGVL